MSSALWPPKWVMLWQAVLGGHSREEGAEGDGEDGDEGDDSPSGGQDGDVVMPVDGLPLPPDSRPGELHGLRLCLFCYHVAQA